MLTKPWPLSLMLLPFSLGYLWSRWKEYQTRVAQASSERQRKIIRVERWKSFGFGVVLLGIVVLALALFSESNNEEFFMNASFVVMGAGMVIALVASITSGWMRGGSAE